jgi:radical SAM/Cys-rich protein
MNEFESRIASVDRAALYARAIEVLQLNVGLRCNLRCTHCHQSSSPERTETMSDEVFGAALALARAFRPRLVDLTGGAPELHPRIREHVAALREASLEVQVRTNLTVLLEPGCEDLPARFARLGVRLLASLPAPSSELVERQRGSGVLESSVAVLRTLNALGYGMGTGLRLDVASNPDGTQLPEAQSGFESAFRRALAETYGVRFDALVVLTNLPLGRFGAELTAAGERSVYLEALRRAFNPATVPLLACRSTLAVAWDGALYDCDFNLGAGLPVRGEQRSVLGPWDALATRPIAFGLHCFACTAKAGSS